MEEVKKRGRPKKQTLTNGEVETDKQVKKRGRKAAIKYFSSDIRKQIPLTTTITDNNEYILHIDVVDNTSEIDDKKVKLEPMNKINEINSFSLITNSNNEEKKERNTNFFKMYQSLVDSTDYVLHTDIYCWWCCHMFKSVPVGYPIQLTSKMKLKTRGVFCSLECIKTYLNDNKKYECYTDLFNYMCKKLCGKSGKDIQQAPPRQVLKIFGGDLDIAEFRNTTKIFKMVEYPLTIVRDYVEEIDINNIKNMNSSLVFSSNLQPKKMDIDSFLK
jgi:hypothetical protein